MILLVKVVISYKVCANQHNQFQPVVDYQQSYIFVRHARGSSAPEDNDWLSLKQSLIVVTGVHTQAKAARKGSSVGLDKLPSTCIVCCERAFSVRSSEEETERKRSPYERQGL